MKKLLSILLCGILVVSIVGCSKANNENTSNNSNTEGKKDKVTLKVFDAMAYGLERYDELVKSFEESHPGVTVEVQHAPNDTNALLGARVSSNDIPDVFAIQVGSYAQSYYEFAYDWSNDKDVLDLFNQSALKTGLNSEGKIMSLPWTYENMGLLYNKDIFNAAGIDKLPQTLDELEQACIDIKAAGYIPFAISAKENWVLKQVATNFMMDKKLDAKGVVEAIDNGSLTFDTMPNFKNLFRFLDLAVEYGPAKPLEVDWETSENMLANGEAAIIHMGDWCQSTLDKFNPDANVGFLPFPVSDNPDDVTLLSSVSWTYIVNKDSDNIDLAKQYLQFILTSDEGIDWITNYIGSVPAAAGAHKVKGKLANDAAAYIKAGKTNGWIHSLMPTGFDTTLGPLMQSYMINGITVEESIKELEDDWMNRRQQ
ncbi:ABC transporter substrate-binding protein [Vallitalea maricola]|uniref:ABC transporter substrate-binding protein n=1 Tax=Vallitalea maricola TaxID=3074433 RepID=A0ACB5UG66_9FIRM|nr:ABC transporter substrate-binding protein [Vallitalea sp. AN17-2]